MSIGDPNAGSAEPAVVDVLVVGGGVAGLVAAREAAHVGLGTVVLEAEDVAGGCVRAVEVAGIRIDAGAESFATRGGSVAELLTELGLGEDIVAPQAAGSWLYLPDLNGPGAVAVPTPQTSLLGIPASPLAADVRAVIGTRGAVRAYLDRITPILTIGHAKRLGPLVRSRMGAKVLDRLVSPLSSGVYSADADDLDIDLIAPGLNAAMTRNGSLSGAVAELRASARAGSAVQGIRGGMSRLVDALVADLEHFGGTVRTGVRATALRRAAAAEADHWEVDVTDREGHATSYSAHRVILAVPAAVALELLSGARPEWEALSVLEWPQPTAVEIAMLVVDAPDLDAAPRGTGALVASGTPGVMAKALTHASAKWAWLADEARRSAAGRQVLRLSYGRVGQGLPTTALTDAEFAEQALADAGSILGTVLSPDQLAGFARTVWTDAVSAASIGQRERIETVTEALGDDHTITAVGSWLAGTGLASVIPHAREAARRIRRDALHTDSGI